MKTKKLLPWGILAVGLGLMGGCASNPVQTTAKENSELLYDGDAQVLYDAKHEAKSSTEAMSLGEHALRVGDTDRALYQFVTAYELDPKQYAALHKVGVIHAQDGKLNRAALAFNLALDANPDHVETLVEMGLVELRMRRYEQAEAHIKRAIESGAGSWRAFNGLGVLADLRQDFESASRHYDAALQSNPSSAILWNNRGYSRYLAGDWKNAQEYIRKALDIDPTYEKAWLNLGLIYVRRGVYQQALAAFNKVMATANAYERVGSLLMMEGKYDDAGYFLNRAIDESPTYYDDAYAQAEKLQSLRGYGDDYDLARGAIEASSWRVTGQRPSTQPRAAEEGASGACDREYDCVE